jgi:RNA polymerase sigma factor (sigma-70 family)
LAELDPLVDRASHGDPAAVDELLATNLPALRAFVRLRMGAGLRAKESSSDLVQSVCREVLQNFERFQFPGAENFRRWLFTTALRVVKNKAKFWQREKRDAGREVRRPKISGSQSGASFSDCYRSLVTPLRDAVAKEEVERFEAVFGVLPEDYQEVISLSRVVGLSHKEIAHHMARSEAAVRQLLHRALAALAIALSPPGGTSGTASSDG